MTILVSPRERRSIETILSFVCIRLLMHIRMKIGTSVVEKSTSIEAPYYVNKTITIITNMQPSQ
jgi:hypothetical protein